MNDYLDYKNKICVVTGAASGIGKATVDLLSELEAQVYALDVNELPDMPNVTFYKTDLNSKESIDDVFS